MNKKLYIPILLSMIVGACDVHQWPETPAVPDRPTPPPPPAPDVEEVTVPVKLVYNPDMYIWEHIFDKAEGKLTEAYPESAVDEQHPGTTAKYDNTQQAETRYRVNLYNSDNLKDAIESVADTREIENTYDRDVEFELYPGTYTIGAWSDLIDPETAQGFYNHDNLLSVALTNHVANNDMRDGFSGLEEFTVEDSRAEGDVVEIPMNRPMAKFEFITTGLKEFLAEESKRSGSEETSDNFTVTISYGGIPVNFNVLNDEIGEESGEISYTTTLSKESRVELSDDEASIGFDYTLVNSGDENAIPVTISVTNKDGVEVTDAVELMVPVRRDHHTVIRGSFLESNYVEEPEPEPEPETKVKLTLNMAYNPDIYVWEHVYNSSTGAVRQAYPNAAVDSKHPGTTSKYDNTQKATKRYIVGVYNTGDYTNSITGVTDIKNVSTTYDRDVEIELEPGTYNVLAWSDLRPSSASDHHYDANALSNISLTLHLANSDFRDGFRGLQPITVASSRAEGSYTVVMNRPMGKYEFVSSNLNEFLAKESQRNGRQVSLNDFTVNVSYSQPVASSYSAVEDANKDSRSGVTYTSELSKTSKVSLSADEVSLGFDYLFANSDNNQTVKVKISVTDKQGVEVTNPVELDVPLRRDHHTVIRGNFLESNYVEPEPETVKVPLKLVYNPDMYVWEHKYDTTSGGVSMTYPSSILDGHIGVTSKYDNTQSGVKRYLVSVFNSGDYTQTVDALTNISNVSGTYDKKVTFELYPGTYSFVAWSDLRNSASAQHNYNASSLTNVSLSNHLANSDYRDGFRGIETITVSASRADYSTSEISMNRPMGKFEFVATDADQFLAHETQRLGGKAVSLSDYTVTVTYSQYMPSSYNAVSNTNRDSKSGESYKSTLSKNSQVSLSGNEASMGYDYVFINSGTNQKVTVRITVTDKNGKQVTKPVQMDVPVQRDHHTVIRGEFLQVEINDGVTIDPDFDGDHNIGF